MKDCAELMFKKGKKHLVMAVDSDTPSNRNKQKGYLRAMLEQGIAKEDIPFYTAVNKEFTNPRDVRVQNLQNRSLQKDLKQTVLSIPQTCWQ